MPSATLHDQSKGYLRSVPDVSPGYTVRVHEKIREGDKERVQVFEGVVISVHNGHVPTDRTFTVRRVVSGVGVEKVFLLHSPMIEKIEVKKVAKVRRAKLFFLRGRQGKSARMIERFTNADEFQSSVVEKPASAEVVAEPVAAESAPASEQPSA
jgi:large subunit ribosomal protein L19